MACGQSRNNNSLTSSCISMYTIGPLYYTSLFFKLQTYFNQQYIQYSCDLKVNVHHIVYILESSSKKNEENILGFSYTAKVNRKTVDSSGIWTRTFGTPVYRLSYRVSHFIHLSAQDIPTTTSRYNDFILKFVRQRPKRFPGPIIKLMFTLFWYLKLVKKVRKLVAFLIFFWNTDDLSWVNKT